MKRLYIKVDVSSCTGCRLCEMVCALYHEGVINLGKAPFMIKRGDRIAQMIINKVYQAHLELCSELSPTERNEGGFGHTGI